MSLGAQFCLHLMQADTLLAQKIAVVLALFKRILNYCHKERTA